MRKIGFCILSLLFGSLTVSTAALADCGPHKGELASLVKAGDIVGAERIVDEIASAVECGPDEERAARLQFAELLLLEANRLRADPGKSERAAQLIEKAAAQDVSWSAALALGDLQHSRHAYAEAAQSYQQAIDKIAGNGSKRDIPQSKLDYLLRRAEESRHLAASTNGKLVAALPGRGVFSEAADRGPVAGKVTVPILFVYNSDAFTPVGEEAAKELVAVLKDLAPKFVVVTGHTDRIGSDAFNLELSRKRAEKVAAFLTERGITSTIRTVGKGRSEPRVLSDPSVYTQDQIDELNRRVEFDWK